MRKIACIFTLILMIFSITACAEKEATEQEAPEKYSKNDIVGEWYSGEIGGSFYFSEDNTLSLIIDMTGTMYIDENNISHIAGSDEDYSEYCHFDGKNYTFELNNVDMINMSRQEPGDSVFGEYTLESGILYDKLSSQYGDLKDRYNIIVDKDVFSAKIRMCEYSAKNGIVTFSGDDLDFFSSGEGKITAFHFAAENDVLTLVDDDNTLVFSR